jgi:hypothetical protein
VSRYAEYSDDFYINMNLNTEMELPQSRETVLHFFEQIQKKYPAMGNFYTREREFILEEDKDRGSYRWASLDARRVCSGFVNPESLESAMDQHSLVVEMAPFSLSVSPLDCESLNIMYGFDFTYRGNHNQLLADALGVVAPLEALIDLPGVSLLGNEPSLQLALDSECQTQCRLSFETRTTAYHVRTGEYPEEQLSVYFTVRRYGSLEHGETYVGVLRDLANTAENLVNHHIVDQVLRPLQENIAIK